MNTLNHIQKSLKSPKGQTNNFGGYKYRSCEDILEAIKPLLGDATLLLNDEIVQIGDRFYVKATASIYDGITISSATAYAREPLEKKGMDTAQITGATSSYARKYALNGLFCIDDTKDADSTNTHDREPKQAKETGKNDESFMKDLEPSESDILHWKNKIELATTLKELRDLWKIVPPMVQDKLAELKDKRKGELGGKS